MIKNIVRDQMFLSKKLEMVKKSDNYMAIVQDLQDTLKANEETCVGMTSNMIGYNKQIVIVSLGLMPMILINPKIVQKSGKYETEEGCLSLDGVRKCTRYSEITVEFFDVNFQKKKQKFSGFIAENIQHQCDHCNGIVV